MLIGYARVSTHDQNLDLQRDALKKAGCDRIIDDVASGRKVDRSGIDQLKNVLRHGDVVIVWRLDRLGRSLKQLITLLEDFEKNGVGFRSLTEAIDTTTAAGKLFFQIIGALAEFERNIIVDRTKAGLQAARARGRLGGRPKKLSRNQRDLAVQLYERKQHSIQEICQMFEISKTTLYAYVSGSNQANLVSLSSGAATSSSEADQIKSA
ncbi:recombinase family protein [Roseiconus lacunae]|uniref:recombinase family protein n=1 Tax=Roseiconus lacunae TaxID=2605694 RepID=UPI001E46E828|nr:recombinase family protein [Roseiconus lacunae]MCD0462091.1 recombinase family protein [Roseiconus lacunae]